MNPFLFFIEAVFLDHTPFQAVATGGYKSGCLMLL
jgi:hypothetical protein